MEAIIDGHRKKVVQSQIPATVSTPFFGILSMHLTPKEVNWISTAGTDGKYLYYNPEFMNSLDSDEIQTLFAHEVMHLALKHPERQGHRNKNKFNAACDYSIHSILYPAGFKLSESALYDRKFDGMEAEKIYELLPDKDLPEWDVHFFSSDVNDGSCGDGNSYNGFPVVGDDVLSDWEVYTSAAMASARMQGKMPGGLEEIIRETFQPKVDWREALRRFIITNYKSDYVWCPPNRKHIHNDLVLPSLSGEGLGTVVVGVDTSGSISDDELKQFMGEIQSILDAYDMELHLIQHDQVVQKEVVYHKGGTLDEVEVKGRGGTSHIYLFHYIENLNPDCVICFTNGYSSFPEKPDCPVLWAVTPDHGKLPWGEVVEIVAR